MNEPELGNGFKLRLYQEKILNTANENNTLVVLPTGLGKTAIAAALTKQRLQTYPNSKIVFLAPTKPLVQQHQTSIKQLLGKEVTLFSGTVSPEKRKDLWEESTIIVSTPQGFENDIISNRISLKKVSLIIFDEAHRATGDYSYVYIAKKYAEVSNHARILALTASPGSDEESIMEICKNLFIEKIEVRSSEDEDVNPYVQNVNIEYVKVELSETMKRTKMFLEKSINSKITEAGTLGYISGTQTYSKLNMLGLIAELQGRVARGEKEFEILKTISLLSEALKTHHALELLETQGAFALVEYMEQLEKQALTSTTKAVKNLVKDINFRSALVGAKKARNEEENPKIEQLKKIVIEELKTRNEKIIIFSQYRDTGQKIKQTLDQEKISSELFVGQAKKKNNGMSQKEQKKIIEEFKENKFNCLIATSVGEEGLDIPEVNLVLFYEPVPSAIRTVQRRGRTGRQKEGKVIILMTKDTRDESYKWVAHHKEKRMYRVLDKIKNNLIVTSKPQQKSIDSFTGITIRVDYREKGSAVMKALLDMNISLELISLNIGDYHLADEVVVEYKKVKDFVDSIIDGRLLSQVKDLRQYKKPFIIIEGEEDIYSQRKINANAIRGMMAAITLNMNIPIIYTKNPRDTAEYLRVIAEREQNVEKNDYQYHTSKPLNDKEQQEYIISSLPGVGTRIAPHLLKHFGNVKNVVNADEKELQKVELVGTKKAKQIQEIINKKYGH